MNQDASRLDVRSLEPGAPLDLAEARNAIAIARLAEADRYAAETFQKASRLLAEAEDARRRGKRGHAVQQPARQAVQTAEDARLIATRRREHEHEAQQRAIARLRQIEAEWARQRAAAEEQRRLAAEAERAAAERARAAAEAERLAAEGARAQAEAAVARLALERLAVEQARLTAEARAQTAHVDAARADRARAELRERLRRQLDAVLETPETARGLIVNISDVLFDFDSANLKSGAREKLARVAGILLTQPGLDLAVEGHTDSVGSARYNQDLAMRRANSVRDYLVRHGIQPGAVATTGFGERRPVATNETASGRQQNRRVELVVSGEDIEAAS